MRRHLLRVRGVEARYGRFVALRNVSLIVPDGAAVALLGPNGVGKTTLLRTVSGMVRPAAEEITFDGERIDGLPDYAIARRGIAHIPEGRGIFPGLSVRDNLTMARFAGGDGSRVGFKRVFELFPVLEQRLDQTAGTLSGGEQQMLSVARAVVTNPRLLMVDELSLGLAPRLVTQLFETIEKIRAQGTAILLVEQYVRHALRVADIVVILHKGKIRFIGEPGELEREEELVQAYLGGTGTGSMALTDAEPPAPSKKSRRRARVSRGSGARRSQSRK
jgi:branched-chain amino acid transport system ATP-binding protein